MDATVVQVFTSRPSGGLTAKRAGVLCAFIAVCLYANTLDCGFCYDDDRAVKSNVDLRPYSPWTGLLWHDFWGTLLNNPASHKSYRPLTVATFRLNYLVHGLQPMGYHLVNVLLHGAVCFLYAVLCAAVFGGVGPALLAGLLFAVHPIHTEAVSWLWHACLLSLTRCMEPLSFFWNMLLHLSCCGTLGGTSTDARMKSMII